MNPISQNIASVSLPAALQSARDPANAQGPSFKDVLLDSIREVNSMQQEANRAVETLATGGDVNPAEVLTAVQKADIAFRMMMQIRNKVVQAYDEVKNIRV
jgi:flagellar hook-basal body complex protein FliE